MKNPTGLRVAAAGSAAALMWAVAGGAHADAPSDTAGAARPTSPADVVLALRGGVLAFRTPPASPTASTDKAATDLRLDSSARTTVPDDPRYTFLGAPGETLWQTGAAPGGQGAWWDTTAVAPGDLGPDGVHWSLSEADGPGAVVVYAPADATDAGTAAAPTEVFNSADGLPDANALPAAASGPLVWAFTRPGDYAVTLDATAELADGSTVRSTVRRAVRVGDTAAPADPAPSADPGSAGPPAAPAARTLQAPVTSDALRSAPVTIGDGHVDALAGRIIDGRLRLVFKDSRAADNIVWREPSSVVVHVNDKAIEHVPAGSAYSFLGRPGSAFWLIPQVQKPGVVWAGWNTEELRPPGLKGPVELTLTSVSGPGSVTVWQTAGLGGSQVIYNSRDGLPDAQKVNLGVHAHANWGFSARGTYKLTFRLKGTPASGTAQTDTRTYTFTVGDGTTGGSSPDGTGGTGSTGGSSGGTGGAPSDGPSSSESAAAPSATDGPQGRETTPGGSLAHTGADGTPALTAGAAALLTIGGTAVWLTRRKSRRAADSGR
ncbi:choice-of-anchor M domain-containing protein [Actinacidiphila alni]|uniref:choice-of-anchor M domain-containing protein n=1 Tax=Actinacidiphila alni TaxID=380248 RepID=UPI0033E8B860